MTTVADLVAKLGFQVDSRGLDNFKKSLQSFQSVVRDGIKDLKEYAKQAEKISRIISNAYRPTQAEARDRYLAKTEAIRLNAKSSQMRAYMLKKVLSIRERTQAVRELQDATKNRALALSEKISPRNIALREETLKFKKDTAPQTFALKEFANRLKEIGLKLKEKSLSLSEQKFEYKKEQDAQRLKSKGGIFGILKGIAGFSFGGVVGGLASLAGFSHPIVMAISLGVKAIVGAIHLVMKTIRDGVKTAMSYRDYRSFTGRNTRGLSALMAASFNTTNLTPEDVMHDAAGLEKQYWDMWFGGGNPRFWQMIGRLPTGNGEKDLQTIIESVFGLSGGFKNRGLARSLLSQAGVSEEYIPLIEDIIKNNPTLSPNELFSRTNEEINRLEEENKILREWDREWKELRVELAKLFIDSKFNEVLKELVDILREVVLNLRRFWGWKQGDTTGAKIYREANKFAERLSPWGMLTGQNSIFKLGYDSIKGLIDLMNPNSSNTNNITTTVNNQVTVATPEEGADYVNNAGANAVDDVWWHRMNPAYRTAGATGG